MTTDCKTKNGITVGLIDSLITTCRVLAPILRKIDNSPKWFSPEIKEALIDLYEDQDVLFILTRLHQSSPYVEDKALYEKIMKTMRDYLKEHKIPIIVD